MKSIEEFDRIRDEIKKEYDKVKKNTEDRILLCMGGGCIASGSIEVRDSLIKSLEKYKLKDDVVIIETGCLGPCARGPVMIMEKKQVFYENVKPEDVDEIVEKHLKNGEIVERLAYRDGLHEKPYPLKKDIDFFHRQTKIVLKNCGLINPLSIEDYINQDGYTALAKILKSMSQDEVLEEMKKSGLRGRGGAGFPTYLKWQFTKDSNGDDKYIICNGDEGDPGAFMDRSILEGDPHLLIEGMAIGAYAIGAKEGYVYVRAEYPLAVERLQLAIKRAKEAGFLGKNILGTKFSFNLDIRMGSGAFVCGEETALIASIEGKRGEPKPRPPFPAQKGLWDKPSVINNVETFANVPTIILNGGNWFAKLGTKNSKGTKVFALAGNINNAGLVEVPVGTSLGELIFDIGGGIPKGKKFKAAQMGGPSGGCVPKQHLNVPLDYESLNELGAIMGSGGLIVMDEDTCMVDVARYFLEFVQDESCGKCVPCRVGTKRMLEILDGICSGQGKESDIDVLIELGNQIKDTALCGLGQTAPNPVLSTIRHFRHEYEEHINAKRCDAGICPGLVRAPCQSACPANVDVPQFVALVGEKRYAEALRLHRERNPFAAVCARVCVHPCESKCKRASLDDAVSIRGVKKFMVDQEITIELPEIQDNKENEKRKIAIIGAGPSGLSCGYFLARLGYRPVIFESEPRPGGMLVQTIPAYRLPREVLAREIRMIEGMGVDIQTGKKLGRDFNLNNLKDDGFEAVFIGVGAPKGILPDMPGNKSEDVIDAIDFLKRYNLRGSVKVGKKVVIVGGGNAAIDAARTAVRLGANSVTIVYRRTREEMPAYLEEIEQAIQEGIIIMTLTNPIEIIAKNGKITSVRCSSMKLGDFDSTGRRRPEVEGEIIDIEADQVIFAVGQTLIGSDFLKVLDNEFFKGDKIKVDPINQQTLIPWIFAGGDVVTGAASVIEAIAAGERAAVGIDEYLTGKNHAFWRKEKRIDTEFDPDAEPVMYPRKSMILTPTDRRKNNFDEVELVWPVNEAIRQAQRCLRCDYGKSC
ncbi:MAG: NADH-quinone oxidoreductase subunit NuoF [Spirochaetes bacterium]|nr:NADH-quinone oxidoreductase subunit NuoF [Spirochaetota bacterium]